MPRESFSRKRKPTQAPVSGGASWLRPPIIHRVFALGAFKSHRFGTLIKGDTLTLVRNGEVDWKEMRHGLVSQHDLEEDLHLDAKTEDISEIQTARLERSGDISFIKKKQRSS